MGGVQDFTAWPMAQPELAHRTTSASLVELPAWHELQARIDAQRAQQERFIGQFRAQP